MEKNDFIQCFTSHNKITYTWKLVGLSIAVQFKTTFQNITYEVFIRPLKKFLKHAVRASTDNFGVNCAYFATTPGCILHYGHGILQLPENKRWYSF